MEIKDLPTVENWSEYSWQNVIHCEADEYGAYIDTHAYEVLTGVDRDLITPQRIKSVPHLWAESPEGWASKDVVVLVELVDGWATLTAWCDTTGFDCQSGGIWKWAATKEDAIQNGLDKEGRIRLGLALPGEADE